MKFLIVSNDEITKDTLCTYILNKGHICNCTGRLSGKEVLALMDEDGTDVVMAELELIKMNDMYFFKIFDKRRHQAKVIIMEGDSDSENGRGLEADGYLHKPGDTDKLRKMIKKVNEIISVEGKS